VSRLLHLLFLSDTHLGFDDPVRRRSRNPHRGPDFFTAFHRALEFARAEHADAVIHGGDLFYRSRVPDSLIDRAMAPLVELAEGGTPVFLVAGNHERSILPRTLFSLHDRIHVFDRPRTFRLTIGGIRLAIGGFPFVREGVRMLFPRLVDATGLASAQADVRVLCIHQLVEGARVGPSGHVFRGGEDVVGASDLPGKVAAILSGHVHRHQVLRVDLSGKPLSAPVIYAGSTERTSFAEIDEAKGCIALAVGSAGDLQSIEFRAIPARPMCIRTLDSGSLSTALARLRSSLVDVDASGVLQIRIPGDLASHSARIVAAVKAMVPPTIFLSFRLTKDLNAFAARAGVEP
jgi:exonuclease SbcD